MLPDLDIHYLNYAFTQVNEGFQCDASVCDLSEGCWGPGPENCRLCAHWLIHGRLERNRCVLNCTLAEGGYFPVVISETVNTTVKIKKRFCSKCHKECGSMPGACHGPDANHCNFGCAHVKVRSHFPHILQYDLLNHLPYLFTYYYLLLKMVPFINVAEYVCTQTPINTRGVREIANSKHN